MPDERTYIKLHDGMPDHPKVDGLSDGAFRLLVVTWCWSSRHLTDGRVPDATWRKRGTARTRGELVSAGLVTETPDGNWLCHDYLEHQRSADEVAALREKRRTAGTRGGLAKAANALALAKQTSSKSLPESETDTDSSRDTSRRDAAKRGTRIPEDWKPNPELIAWQRDNGISDSLARRELPKFIDYWRAKAKDATKLDWDGTWRNWLRSAQEREPESKVAQRVEARRHNPLGSAL